MKVEQICARPIRHGEDDSHDGHDHNDETMDYVHDSTNAAAARGVSLGVRLFLAMVAGDTPYKIFSTFLGQLFSAVDEDLEMWTISGMTEFNGYDLHTVGSERGEDKEIVS